jgi:formate hydrogenlyase subunit 6/NADH:ubiquinone oxidoreductase subunit I
MIRPGKMVMQLLQSFFKKPATMDYPHVKTEMPDKFRGKLKYYPERCIGCMMCMKDCPTGAIVIKKVGEKKFEAHIDLSLCIYCAQCVDSCPKKALEATKEFELAKRNKVELKVVFDAKPDEDIKGETG